MNEKDNHPNQSCSICPNDAKKPTGPGKAGLVFEHDGQQYVKQRVGSDTPELSLSVNTSSRDRRRPGLAFPLAREGGRAVQAMREVGTQFA